MFLTLELKVLNGILFFKANRWETLHGLIVSRVVISYCITKPGSKINDEDWEYKVSDIVRYQTSLVGLIHCKSASE